jgi:hypothetical protein
LQRATIDPKHSAVDHHFENRGLHHRDVVGLALRRLERDLESDRAGSVVTDLERELGKTGADKA